jgi:hypothetical protein
VIGSRSRTAVVINNVNYYKTRGKHMRILMLRNYKIFLKDVSEEGDPDFTAYFYGEKETDPNMLIRVECWLRDFLRSEIEAENENMRLSYAENQRSF